MEEEYSRWDYLYNNGCSDPFWEDGCNLNLVRNHVNYCKSQIKEFCDKKKIELPEEYFKPLPVEVPNNYMAVPEKIQNEAKEAYKIFCSSDVFEKLLNITYMLDKDKKEIAKNIVGYKRGLEMAIKKNELVAMRRFNAKRANQIIKDAWKFIDENSKPKGNSKPVQMSLFEVMG